MAGWEDAPLLTPSTPAAAPAAAPVTEGWESAPLLGSNAQAKATVNSNVNPDEAGRALRIGKQIGVPPSIVQTDMPGYDAHAKTQSAITAVQNPAMARYIDKNPMASQVSNDDYTTLNKISNFFSALSREGLDHATSLALSQQSPALADLQSTEPGREKMRGYLDRIKAGFYGGFGETSDVAKMLSEAKEAGLSQQVVDFWEGAGLLPAARAIEGGIRLVPGVIGGAFGALSGLVAEGTGNEAWADRLLRDAPAANAALMGTAASPLARAPKFAPVDPLHTFLAEHTSGGPRAKALSAGETPPDQLWQARPIIDQAKAESAGAALDSTIEASKESKTLERSPELFEEFLASHGVNGTVSIPAQSILDIYKREGKVPIPGDGLFGDIPGLADKATLAAETGGDVTIPMKKYVTIAAKNDTLHEGLKDTLRVNEGKSREEAKAAVEEQKASIEAFHGTPHDFENFDLTKIGTGEGAQVYGHGLYFAENRAVGEGYKGSVIPNAKAIAENLAGPDIEIRYPLQLALDRMRADKLSVDDAVQLMHSEYEHFPAEKVNKAEELLRAYNPDFTKEGQLYKVRINADPTQFLDWDLPIKEHSDEVLAKMAAVTDKELSGALHTPETVAKQLRLLKELDTPMGEWLDAIGLTKGHHGLIWNDSKVASAALAEAGIPGIKYLDQGSRPDTANYRVYNNPEETQFTVTDYRTDKDHGTYKTKEEAFAEAQRLNDAERTRNFVVFDDKLVKIIEKNDNPVVQATVEATAAAKQSLYLEPLFKDGKTLNITQTEFKKYSDQIDRAQERVLDKAVALAKREVARRLTPEWKANEVTMQDNVAAEMWDRPDFAADRFFNQGLNSEGEKLRPELRVKLGAPGVLADEWAPAFGFESGSDMTMAVLRLEQERADTGKGPKAQFQAHVDAETARQMEAVHGNLADNIAIEASEEALAHHNVDILATEWRMLAEAQGKEPPLSRTELESWAKDQFDRSLASEVSYEGWRRASEKGGREAEKAFLKGDVTEAFVQKQRQMLSFLLAREAKAFEKDQARAEKLFDKYASDVALDKVDQRYTDQIHRQLQTYGIDTRRTQENTDYNLQNPLPDGRPNSLSNFIDHRNKQGDLMVEATLPTPRPGTNARPIDSFTVNQYRDFATMIQSMDKNGRAAKEIELHGKKEAFNEVIDKVAKNLDGLEKNNFNPEAKGAISALRKLGREVDSRLLKAEKLIDWIDKKDPLGAMNSTVLRGLLEGEQAKGDMITKLAKMAGELPGDRAWGKALNDLTTNNELLDWETGKPKKLTNENKIAIALNYGNKSNRRVMLEGYHWTEAEVESYLSRELTSMDKAVVDGIHGLFEPLAPLVEKATSSRAGVAVPLIEGTPWNGMKGGYYPLIEDPRAKLLGQQVETDLFEKTKFDPLPTANALKQRTGKIYPVDLTISQIHSRLSQTAHAVFMQDPVINANKVLADPAIREGVYKAFGPEYVSMLDKWIRDIANNGGSDVGFHDDTVAWLSRNVRQNVVAQLMGWKVSTALIHGGSAGASSLYELGKMDLDTTGRAGMSFIGAPAALVKNMKDLGLGQFLPDATRRLFGSQSNMFNTIDFVMDNSGEMRNRQKALAKDFGYELNKIMNTNLLDDAARLRAIHQTYSMAMVAYLDQLTATPVWKAAYDKATVADGLEHADAVYVADKAVREAHGSASLVSRANVGRGEINKWLTIAYNGYWNHNYNKLREAGKDVAGYDDSFSNLQRVAIGAAFATAMIVAPALVHHAVRGSDEKTVGGTIGAALMAQFAGTVPIVNTLVYSMMHNRDPSVSPINDVLASMTNLVRDQKAANPQHTIRHVGQAVGFLTGLPPTNQTIDTFTFMNDILHRRQDPKTVAEWSRGVMTGKSQPKAHR